MKKVYSFFITLPVFLIFLISCNADQEPVPAIHDNHFSSALSKVGTQSPDNIANPYDLAGKIHNEIFDAYFETNSLPQTISGIIDRVDVISKTNTNFIGLGDGIYNVLTPNRASYILSNSGSEVPSIFNNAAISVRARNSLKSFIESLLILCESEQDYALIYKYISDYENLVIHDSLFSQQDKKMLLTTTSIARFSASKKRRPKPNTDTDWEVNIFHVVGSIEGMSQSTSAAITSAVSLGIAGNQ